MRLSRYAVQQVRGSAEVWLSRYVVQQGCGSVAVWFSRYVDALLRGARQQRGDGAGEVPAAGMGDTRDARDARYARYIFLNRSEFPIGVELPYTDGVAAMVQNSARTRS